MARCMMQNAADNIKKRGDKVLPFIPLEFLINVIQEQEVLDRLKEYRNEQSIFFIPEEAEDDKGGK